MKKEEVMWTRVDGSKVKISTMTDRHIFNSINLCKRKNIRPELVPILEDELERRACKRSSISPDMMIPSDFITYDVRFTPEINERTKKYSKLNKFDETLYKSDDLKFVPNEELERRDRIKQYKVED